MRQVTSKLRRMFFRVRVTGESMYPELVSGKRYWATSLGKPQAENYLVFRDPKSESIFVKKVSRVTDVGYEVASSVPWGSSSKDFGIVPRDAVIGKLI